MCHNHFINLPKKAVITGFMYFTVKNIEAPIIKWWRTKVLTQVFPRCYYLPDLPLANCEQENEEV